MTISLRRTRDVRAIFVALALALPLVSQFGVAYAVAWTKGEKGLGQVLIAMSIVGIFSLVGDAGVGSEVLRQGHAVFASASGTQRWSARFGFLGASLLSLAFGCFFASPIAAWFESFSATNFRVAALAGFFNVVASDELALDAAAGLTRRWALRSLARTIVIGLGTVSSIVWLGWGVYPAVLAGVVLGSAVVALSLRDLRGWRLASPLMCRQMIRRGATLTLGVAFGAGSLLLAPIIASRWIGLREIGHLRSAMLISGGILSICAAGLASHFLPRVSALSAAQWSKFVANGILLAVGVGSALSMVPLAAFAPGMLGIKNTFEYRRVWILIAITDGVRLVAYVCSYALLPRTGLRRFVLREVVTGSLLVGLVSLAASQGSLSAVGAAYLAAGLCSVFVNGLGVLALFDRERRRVVALRLSAFLVAMLFAAAAGPFGRLALLTPGAAALLTLPKLSGWSIGRTRSAISRNR